MRKKIAYLLGSSIIGWFVGIVCYPDRVIAQIWPPHDFTATQTPAPPTLKQK